MNTEQEYYYFRNTTNSTIIVSDLTRPASIGPRTVSRSFSSEEVRQSSDIRRFYQLGILVQEDNPMETMPLPLKRSLPGRVSSQPSDPVIMPRAGVPEGIDVVNADDKGGSYVSAQGTEFVNPRFVIGDFVHLKGPSNMSGKIIGRRGSDGRWVIALPDGRTAYAYEESLQTIDQFAVSQPAEATKKTLSASEVLKRGLVPKARQQEFQKNSNSRIHADDVLRNRTGVPASQLKGRALPGDVEAPVSGGRFNVDEVKGRPAGSGTEIVMADGRVVNSEVLINDRITHPDVSVGDQPSQEEDRGTIVIGGAKDDPLGGEEVTTHKLIKDTVENAGREMSKAEKKRIANLKYREKLKGKKVPAAAPVKASKGAPSYVGKFLSLSPSEQKLYVVRENDVEKLLELASFIPAGSVIKKLVEDRITQLKIA